MAHFSSCDKVVLIDSTLWHRLTGLDSYLLKGGETVVIDKFFLVYSAVIDTMQTDPFLAFVNLATQIDTMITTILTVCEPAIRVAEDFDMMEQSIVHEISSLDQGRPDAVIQRVVIAWGVHRCKTLVAKHRRAILDSACNHKDR